MCYHILSQTGKVISISTEHWITNIELSPDEAKETFVKFDAEIHRRIKVDNCRYKRSKKSPKYWADMLEEDIKF